MAKKYYIIRLIDSLLDYKPGDIVIVSQWIALWTKCKRTIISTVILGHLYLSHEVNDIKMVGLDCKSVVDDLERRMDTFKGFIDVNDKNKEKRDRYKQSIKKIESKIKRVDKEAKKVIKMMEVQ